MSYNKKDSTIGNLNDMRNQYIDKQSKEKDTNNNTANVILYTQRAIDILLHWYTVPSKNQKEIDEYNKTIKKLNLVLIEIYKEEA